MVVMASALGQAYEWLEFENYSRAWRTGNMGQRRTAAGISICRTEATISADRPIRCCMSKRTGSYLEEVDDPKNRRILNAISEPPRDTRSPERI